MRRGLLAISIAIAGCGISDQQRQEFKVNIDITSRALDLAVEEARKKFIDSAEAPENIATAVCSECSVYISNYVDATFKELYYTTHLSPAVIDRKKTESKRQLRQTVWETTVAEVVRHRMSKDKIGY